jgi:hypothetical protein
MFNQYAAVSRGMRKANFKHNPGCSNKAKHSMQLIHLTKHNPGCSQIRGMQQQGNFKHNRDAATRPEVQSGEMP